MTNKLVVIINSLKVPKIKKILLYEMKFLVPIYSCHQNPGLGSYRLQIPVLSVLCLLNWICWTPPPEQTSWVHHWFHSSKLYNIQCTGQNNWKYYQVKCSTKLLYSHYFKWKPSWIPSHKLVHVIHQALALDFAHTDYTQVGEVFIYSQHAVCTGAWQGCVWYKC